MQRLSRNALATTWFAGSLLVASSAAAQTTVLTISGKSIGDRLAQSVAGIGDVDGDGVPDWAVGAPLSDLAGNMSGSALVFSGATGAELYEFSGDSPIDFFGSSVAGGDLNGDGRADIVVGAYADDVSGVDAGTVYAYSGLDGSLLWTQGGTSAGDNFGFSVAFVPDTDGDGRGEVLVGAWTADGRAANSGEAKLLDGDSGAQLQVLRGLGSYDFFGKSVAGVGDVNGDGLGDLLVGAPGESTNGAGAGAAYLFSGASGALLASFLGEQAGDGLGSCVADAGDVDADLSSDLVLGIPGADQGGNNAGRVRVHSGASGAVLRDLLGSAPGDNFGSAVLGDVDVDGDGRPELVVGVAAADPNGASSGQVQVFSGQDGSLLASLDGEQVGGRYGAAVANAGDIDLDGADELLIGAWGEGASPGDLTGVLRAVTFGGGASLTYNYCVSTQNSFGMNAIMQSSGPTSVGANLFQLGVQSAAPSSQGLFFYGPNETQVPFGLGFRCVGGPIFRLSAVLTDVAGDQTIAVDLANPPSEAGRILPGSTWKFQFWYRDALAIGGNFNLSDGLSATFTP